LLILQCYNRRFELVRFERQVNEIKEYVDSNIKIGKELHVKEKVLEEHREGTKLSWRELDLTVDDNAII
jgi:hypothetical protein